MRIKTITVDEESFRIGLFTADEIKEMYGEGKPYPVLDMMLAALNKAENRLPEQVRKPWTLERLRSETDTEMIATILPDKIAEANGLKLTRPTADAPQGEVPPATS